MKKIYRFKHNPYPPHPPPFPWPWDVCLEFSKLKPRFEKILDPPPPPLLTLNLTLNKMKYAIKALLIKKETE